MKVYVIVEVTHTHARGTVHELVSNAFISEELAQEVLEQWTRPETPLTGADLIIRELRLVKSLDPLETPEEEIEKCKPM